MQLFWGEFASAFGFGLLASLVPVFNAETFIVATVATGLIGPVPLGIGLGLGQGLGKAILFQLTRQGKKLPWLKRRQPQEPEKDVGKWRLRWRWLVKKSVSLLEHRGWGPVVVFASGAISVPPNYATTLVAGTTRVNAWMFGTMMTLGYVSRNLVEALIFAGVLSAWL